MFLTQIEDLHFYAMHICIRITESLAVCVRQIVQFRATLRKENALKNSVLNK